MSLWGALFGTSKRYPQVEHALSALDIDNLVSRAKVRSLDPQEEKLVEEALKSRRRGDGKISMQQIYEVLLKLQNQNKISQYDKDGLMRVFEQYFESKFGK